MNNIQNNTDSTRPNRRVVFALLALIVLLVAASVFACIYFYTSREDAAIAQIYQDGTLIETIDLSTVSETYQFTIEGTDSAYNTIEVRPDGIGIVDASCPDKLCIHTGFTHSSSLPIVCLPNKLVIELHEKSDDSNTLDTITF